MSSEGEANMAAALQNLSIAWEEVRDSWRDAKAVEFEERYLKDLPGEMSAGGHRHGGNREAAQQAKHDCG